MGEVMDTMMDVNENVERYFNDPNFASSVAQVLQKVGYTADAIESEMFVDALPRLLQFEKLIASAEKRVMLFFREMDRIFGVRAVRAKAIANEVLDSKTE